MALNFDTYGALPGVYAAVQESAAAILANGGKEAYIQSVIIWGGARDVGNTGQTNVLRPGLIMGAFNLSAASNKTKFKEFNNAATDGTQNATGVLLYALNTQQGGADQDRWLGWVCVHGSLIASQLIVPSNVARGIANATDGTSGTAAQVRTALNKWFYLDDTPYQ